MKIEKVSYQKAYIIGPYLQEKVGFEASYNPNEETAEDVLSKLRKMADEWHKENNPHLEFENSSLPVIRDINADAAFSFVDQQFEQLKSDLEKIGWRQEAEAVLSGTDFRYNIELKKIVNSKPLMP